MSWAVGYDTNWERDIGYVVPSKCDHPECNKEINRGLSYVCGGEPYGGEYGCGLFFCEEHLFYSDKKPQRCEKCIKDEEPFEAKKDTEEWINNKLTDESWSEWREENKEFIENATK